MDIEEVVSYQNYTKLTDTISHKDFLRLLAAFIIKEANVNPDFKTPEPYRAAGDRLTDAALEFVD